MTLFLLLFGCPPGEPTFTTCASCEEVCAEESFPETTRDHVTDPIDYADPPPTNGDHNACWATWGEHPEEVPDENWVHNLEHGGVVFVYSCPEGCDEDLVTLRAMTAALPAGRWVLTPYSEMGDWKFAAVAWDHRILTGCLDIEAFQAFYDKHVGRGPEDTTAEPSGCM